MGRAEPQNRRTAEPEDLLVLYQEGDPQAFRRLVDEFQPKLLQFFFRLCWDRDRAEDLAQEVFLKLMRGSRRYRPEGRLTTFVYRIATNLWIDHYRAQRPQPRLYSLDQAVLAPGGELHQTREHAPTERVIHDEEKQALRGALESLTEPHRLVFELAVYQELPYAEIGQILDMPVGTGKSRMHNSVKALKVILAERGQRAREGEGPASGSFRGGAVG